MKIGMFDIPAIVVTAEKAFSDNDNNNETSTTTTKHLKQESSEDTASLCCIYQCYDLFQAFLFLNVYFPASFYNFIFCQISPQCLS